MTKNSQPPASSSGSTSATLKEVKAMQRERRLREKEQAKAQRRDKRATKGPGVISQLKQAYAMTKAHDPKVGLWMLLAFLGALVVGLVIGLLLDNWITWLLIAIPFGVLAAVVILNRKARRAGFAQLEGRPGAAGAALSTLGRGWIVSEQPAAVNPKTQDLVYRAVGRPGVVLVTEGPSPRVAALVVKEEKAMRRFLPGVPVTVVESGNGQGQVPLHELPGTLKGMKKALTAQEVQAVDKRLTALNTNRLPIPKGVDPNKVRPSRRAMRGRCAPPHPRDRGAPGPVSGGAPPFRRVRPRVESDPASSGAGRCAHMRISTVPATLSCMPRPSGPTTTAGSTRHSSAVRTTTRCTGAVRPPRRTTWVRHTALPTVVASRVMPRMCMVAKTIRVAIASESKSSQDTPRARNQSITRATARRAAVAIEVGPCSGRPSRSPGQRPPARPPPGPSTQPARSRRVISGSSRRVGSGSCAGSGALRATGPAYRRGTARLAVGRHRRPRRPPGK